MSGIVAVPWWAMDFSPFSFCLGAAFGWGLQWVLDRWWLRGAIGNKLPADNAFKADLLALRTRFDDAQVKLEAYETEVNDLRAQLRDNTPADSYELQVKLREANAEIAALKMAVPAIPSDNPTDSSVKQELAEAKAMIERLQSENNTSPLIALNELQAKLDEAESELAGYRSVEEISRIELQELRQKLAEAESKGGSKGKNSANSDDMNALKALLDSKEHELAVLKAQGSGSSALDEETRTKASQADYFARQLENARATIATLEQEMLKPAVAAAMPTAGDDELKRHNAELQTEILRLQSAYEAQQEDIAVLKHQVQEREQNIQRMASLDELVNARNRAEAAEERVTAMMSERQSGLEEFESLRRQVQSFDQDSTSAAALRQEIEDLSAKLASRDQAVSEARADFNSLSARFVASQTELDDLRSARAARENELQTLRDEVSNLQDSLQTTEGLAAKLKDAEIELEAYNDIKNAKERLQDRVGQLEGELAEAKALAKEAELEAKTREAERAAAEVAQLRAHLDHHRTALANALSQLDNFEPTTPEAPRAVFAPTPPPVETQPVTDVTEFEVEEPADEPAPVAAAQPEAELRDPLERIKGVGFVYERKLWDAGILTFADLAKATPEEVTKAINPEEWQQIDPRSWINEAKKLMGN